MSPFSRRSAVYFHPSSFAASLASVSALMTSQRCFMRISCTASKASLCTWERSSTRDARGSERFRQYSDAARCSAEKHASVRHIFLQPGNIIPPHEPSPTKKADPRLDRLSFEVRDTFSLPSQNGGYLLSHFYAVPSTWLGLTSLFGMGRGGSPTL